jgi:hypothetical protein
VWEAEGQYSRTSASVFKETLEWVLLCVKRGDP